MPDLAVAAITAANLRNEPNLAARFERRSRRHGAGLCIGYSLPQEPESSFSRFATIEGVKCEENLADLAPQGGLVSIEAVNTDVQHDVIFTSITNRFFPSIRILHPLLCHRFDARTRGKSPVR